MHVGKNDCQVRPFWGGLAGVPLSAEGAMKMYAVIEVGAKQYNVKKDDIIEVEREATPAGKEIAIDKVLLVSKDKQLEVGTPYVKGAKVSVLVLGEIKAKKLISYKYRRRKSSHWEKGHRQKLTRLQVKEISL
jgi:large subunit ribosomal protein L21